MRSTIRLALTITIPFACLAQQWELGATGGYGWYENPAILSPIATAHAGFPAKGLFGMVLGDNMHEYVGGEIRYLFQFGGPELRSGGIQENKTGYTNLVDYDVLLHFTPRDGRLRPFVAGGSGIKVFTGSGPDFVAQPLLRIAALTPHTQVEPVLSAGGGLKYRIARRIQVRVDFRTYFSPLPCDIFRTTGLSAIHGWVYNFVPMAGISYVF